jgi:hypothetical protein
VRKLAMRIISANGDLVRICIGLLLAFRSESVSIGREIVTLPNRPTLARVVKKIALS